MVDVYRASKPDDKVHGKDDFNYFRAQIPRELLEGEY